MVAEIISVGTELLLGQIVNTDAQFLSVELSAMGIDVYRQITVGDNKERLKDAISDSLARADLVILSGGLGPTEDDLTKETLAEHFGLEMRLDTASLETIQGFFKKMNREMTPNNEKQAMFPDGSIILPNPNGTAPGCIVERQGKIVAILPGPPRELEPMFRDSVKPYLAEKQQFRLVSQVLRIYGMGESSVEHRLKDLMQQKNPTLAPYAKLGEVTLRLTVKCGLADDAETLLEPLRSEIKRRLEDVIYSENDEELSEVALRVLRERDMTLALAESCTGGMVSAMLVDNPGASGVLLESQVVYSDEAKARLGVRRETLAEFGAVSEQTAREMAVCVRERSGASLGLAITGIAGPGGGTDQKPVGLVYIALADAHGVNVVSTRQIGDRARIRALTSLLALDWIRRHCSC